MDAAQITALVTAGGKILGKVAERIDKNYGLVHRRTPVVIDGEGGDLVWDYVVMNEITFETHDGKKYSFFTSFSDKETERVWNELVRKFSPPVDLGSVSEYLKTIEEMIDTGGRIFEKVKVITDRTYGFIHKRTPVVINGKTGFLIWDYIVWNEITFQDDEGNGLSFFTSISDKETEEVWNELVRRFGV